MFKKRAALLGALALLVLGGIATSQASAAGPYWRVNGARLEKGSKFLNAEGGATELKATVLGLSVTISCAEAGVENARLIGNGTSQGQDSAKTIAFEKCKVTSPKQCAVAKTITTVEVTSHLVIFTNAAKEEKIGDLFDPATGTEFVTITLENHGEEKCPFAETPFPVKGSAVAEVSLEGTEAVSGELTFPKTPITEVKTEGGAAEAAGLEIGSGNKASFNGKFTTNVLPGEKFGAFKT
jgi:hypothetical protein